MSTTAPLAATKRTSGPLRVLITIYAILAIGAISRAIFQMFTKFSEAPVPITLSLISGIVYVVATIALVKRAGIWYRVAVVTISFELVGVLTVGTLSVVAPAIFADDSSVWSYYGIGYVFIPVALPVLGLIYLWRSRRARVEA
jgi:hypothetical protein